MSTVGWSPMVICAGAPDRASRPAPPAAREPRAARTPRRNSRILARPRGRESGKVDETDTKPKLCPGSGHHSRSPCASIITQPIEPQANKKSCSRKRNYPVSPCLQAAAATRIGQQRPPQPTQSTYNTIYAVLRISLMHLRVLRPKIGSKHLVQNGLTNFPGIILDDHCAQRKTAMDDIDLEIRVSFDRLERTARPVLPGIGPALVRDSGQSRPFARPDHYCCRGRRGR